MNEALINLDYNQTIFNKIANTSIIVAIASAIVIVYFIYSRNLEHIGIPAILFLFSITCFVVFARNGLQLKYSKIEKVFYLKDINLSFIAEEPSIVLYEHRHTNSSRGYSLKTAIGIKMSKETYLKVLNSFSKEGSYTASDKIWKRPPENIKDEDVFIYNYKIQMNGNDQSLIKEATILAVKLGLSVDTNIVKKENAFYITYIGKVSKGINIKSSESRERLKQKMRDSSKKQ